MDKGTCSNCSHKIFAMEVEIKEVKNKCQTPETEVAFLRSERDHVQTKLSQIQCVADKSSDGIIRFFTDL